MLIENLEWRRMLAADFVADAAGLDVELQRVGAQIQVINRADGAVILEEDVTDIDSKHVEITSGSLLVDSSVDLGENSLSVLATSVEVLSGTLQSSGSISLVASDQPSVAASVFTDTLIPGFRTTRSANINLSGATLSGQDITISANGETTTRWDDVGGIADDIGGQLLAQLQVIPQVGMSAISPISGQAKVHEASSQISLTDTTIQSSSTVTIGATAAADASVNGLALNGIGDGGSPVLVSLALSSSTSSANVDLLGTTRIDADGRVDITSHASSKAVVVSRAEGNTRLSNNSVQTAFNLALGFTNETSKIQMAPGTMIEAGDSVRIDATGYVENKLTASTTIFQDATGGLSAAIGFDDADIGAEVAGSIVSRAAGSSGALQFTDGDINAATDRIRLTTIPASDPISVGDRITYRGGTTDIGLVDGRQYIVHEVSDPTATEPGRVAQSFELIGAESIDLDARQVPTDSVHTLSRLVTMRSDAADVTTESGSGDGLIAFPSLPAGIETVIYLGPDTAANPDAAAIAGLIQNQAYEAVRVGDVYKLRLPGSTAFIDFARPADGEHGFYYTELIDSFVPATAVDNERETIQLADLRGLKTGDLVFYGTDPSRTIERELQNFGDGTTTPSALASFTLPDAPIGGLLDDMGYRVIVDETLPNSIRLTTSLLAAMRGDVEDLQSSGGTGHRLERANRSQGIFVGASLQAKNQADAGAALSDEEQPWTEVVIGTAQGQADSIATGGKRLIDAVRSGLNQNSVDQAKSKTGTDAKTNTSVELAGAVALATFQHDVLAIVAPTGVLTSDADIIVDGQITQSNKVAASAEATRNGNDVGENVIETPANSESDTEISAAVAVGVYDNEARAIVSAGAVTDAKQQTPSSCGSRVSAADGKPRGRDQPDHDGRAKRIGRIRVDHGRHTGIVAAIQCQRQNIGR